MKYVILILMLLAAACEKPSLTGEVIFESRNCRKINVPYETEGYYLEEEGYEEQECIQVQYNHSIEYVTLYRNKGRLVLYYYVVNRDNGKFRLKAGATWFINGTELDSGNMREYRVFPGGRLLIERHFLNASPQHSGTYNVEIPNKTICRNVTKTRESVRHGTIMKNRTETICRT
ncbi:hypothetical protein GF323_03025 [Candidatus Woesearchaeota archaeon]|nr:hypothetical protein [Candidatus Woesearchaeota archaeon]